MTTQGDTAIKLWEKDLNKIRNREHVPVPRSITSSREQVAGGRRE
jgi:hypothetical protein